MRRARIKVQATVPVRRKTAQEIPKVKEEVVSNEKIDEHPEPEKNITNNNDSTIIAKEQNYESDNLSNGLQTPVNNVVSNETENVQLTPQKCDRSQTPQNEISPTKSISSRSCFMRPMPRLDGGGRVRRNSVQGSGASASESEDDTRKSHVQSRIRNDSMCSVQSNKDGGINPLAKLNLTQKRKIVVSESARKLAEARREFLRKHDDNKPPDRSKLTMYDLIYYNPINNPMTVKPRILRNANPPESPSPKNFMAEKDKEEIEEEPTAMPVPQVKVGPNGQLIIDEQSLVIDQYKAQESIDRSDIIVDEDNSSGGFYFKKKFKSKEWSKWETVKFYRALGTYGTDFSLMHSMFPNRDRYELKLKYKKEDVVRRELVEKALRYQEFDTERLEKDFENLEEKDQREHDERQKKKSKENGKPLKKKKRKRCMIAKKAIEESSEADTETDDSDQSVHSIVSNSISKNLRKRKTPVRKKKELKFVDEEDISENIINTPARSVKKIENVPDPPITTTPINVENKIQRENKTSNTIVNKIDTMMVKDVEFCNGDLDYKLQDNETVEEESVIEIVTEEIQSEVNVSGVDAISKNMDNLSGLQPGEIVIIKNDCADEPEKCVLEVFVVSENYDATCSDIKDFLVPIDISPEILQKVTNFVKGDQEAV